MNSDYTNVIKIGWTTYIHVPARMAKQKSFPFKEGEIILMEVEPTRVVFSKVK